MLLGATEVRMFFFRRIIKNSSMKTWHLSQASGDRSGLTNTGKNVIGRKRYK